MKGSSNVIEQLNQILANELVAINQYFLHSRILKDAGYEQLADKFFQEAVEEMRHADTLTQRVLFLEGHPNLQKLGQLHIGENVKEMLESDLGLEMRAIPDLREAIAVCEGEKDFASRDLLEVILKDEENHVDWIEAQLGMIKDMGVENYLQSAA
ncbi:MAG: bacterioferritin [Gammaproteobacteria bacterium AqS3]|nr:bacterioferritin [Gammaproteobacteria bacterium AqS3]